LRCPGSVGIDALSQRDWSEHFNLCFHLSSWFHRSYPSSGNSVQPLSFSYLSGRLALGGLYCLKDSTSFLLYTVVACYHA
jgi:hypothetical protein